MDKGGWNERSRSRSGFNPSITKMSIYCYLWDKMLKAPDWLKKISRQQWGFIYFVCRHKTHFYDSSDCLSNVRWPSIQLMLLKVTISEAICFSLYISLDKSNNLNLNWRKAKHKLNKRVRFIKNYKISSKPLYKQEIWAKNFWSVKKLNFFE